MKENKNLGKERKRKNGDKANRKEIKRKEKKK